MRTRWIGAAFAAVNIAFQCLLPQQAVAQAAEVRVFGSDGVKAVMEAILPQCERAIGRPIGIEFNTSTALKQKIESGERFDVTILTTGLIDDLVRQGKIIADTRANVARSRIGVGVRAGAPKPDISTSERMKRVLLNAKSITYAQDGASRSYIERMYERLGITEDVKPKIILQQAPGRPQGSVAEGKAELVITLISEILPIHGIELLGPLPAEFQNEIAFAAGVATNSRNPAAAKALVRFLTGPAVAPTFRAKGMEPR